MSVDRLLLEGDRATAFDEALERRGHYIRDEQITLLIDGEKSVHYPGCPSCGEPAESVCWSTYDRGPGGVLEIDVDPCGHRFRTEPVPERFW